MIQHRLCMYWIPCWLLYSGCGSLVRCMNICFSKTQQNSGPVKTNQIWNLYFYTSIRRFLLSVPQQQPWAVVCIISNKTLCVHLCVEFCANCSFGSPTSPCPLTLSVLAGVRPNPTIQPRTHTHTHAESSTCCQTTRQRLTLSRSSISTIGAGMSPWSQKTPPNSEWKLAKICSCKNCALIHFVTLVSLWVINEHTWCELIIPFHTGLESFAI